MPLYRVFKNQTHYEILTWLFLCLFVKCARIGDNSKSKVVTKIFSDLNLEEKLALPIKIQLWKRTGTCSYL